MSILLSPPGVYGLGTAVLLLAILLMWMIFSGSGLRLPRLNGAGGRLGTAIRRTLSGKTIALFVALAALEFALWKSNLAPAMFEGPGLIHIPTYALLLAAAVLVETNLRGKLLTAGRAMIIVAFTLFGLSHLWAPKTPEQLAAEQTAAIAEAQTKAKVDAIRLRAALEPSTSAQCPGTGKSIRPGAGWTEINPGFGCHVTFEVVGGSVELGEPENFVEVTPGSSVGNVLKENGVRVIYARVSSGNPILNYVLCPQGAGTGGWSCLPKGRPVRQTGIALGLNVGVYNK